MADEQKVAAAGQRILRASLPSFTELPQYSSAVPDVPALKCHSGERQQGAGRVIMHFSNSRTASKGILPSHSSPRTRHLSVNAKGIARFLLTSLVPTYLLLLQSQLITFYHSSSDKYSPHIYNSFPSCESFGWHFFPFIKKKGFSRRLDTEGKLLAFFFFQAVFLLKKACFFNYGKKK